MESCSTENCLDTFLDLSLWNAIYHHVSQLTFTSIPEASTFKLTSHIRTLNTIYEVQGTGTYFWFFQDYSRLDLRKRAS